MTRTITEKITIQMRELEDSFVSETILPYLGKVTNWNVSKKELIDALDKQIPKKPIVTILDDEPEDKCPGCGVMLGSVTKFCPDCGQRLDFGEVNDNA